MPHQGRLTSIQMLRGVAALLVVSVHACDLARFRAAEVGDRLGWLSQPNRFSDFGASGVDLFFVISGLVMGLAITRPDPISPAAFVRARVIRIVPLYVVATLVFAAERVLAGRFLTLPQIVTSVSFVPQWSSEGLVQPVLPVGWTLAFELAFYALLLPVLVAPVRKRIVLALAVVVALVAVGLASGPRASAMRLLLNPIWLEFAFGLALARIGGAAGAGRLRPLPLVGGLVLLGLAGLFRMVGDVRPEALFTGGAGELRALAWGLPWAMIVFGIMRHEAAGRVARALAKLGDASYALYLSHLCLFLPLELAVPAGWIAPDLLSVGAVAGAVALGLVVHARVERPLAAAIRRARTASGASRPRTAIQGC